MSIDKLPVHYSMQNHATIYDEEALTALELAARTTAKVNEVVEDQNKLADDTRTHLAEQDAEIAERTAAQDAAIKKMNDVTMPAKVDAEVQERIDNGAFDRAIDDYAGNLEARVDNLLGSVTPGSTSMDAEIVDMRTGADNVTYASAGTATREQFKRLNDLMDMEIHDLTDGETTGHYIAFNGNYVSESGASHSAPIAIKKGYTVMTYLRGVQQNIATIAEFVDGGYRPLVVCIDNVERWYTYTAEKDMQVVISYLNSATTKSAFTIVAPKENVRAISENTELLNGIAFIPVDMETGEEGYYIGYSGTKNAVDGYRITTPVFMYRGTKITCTLRGYGHNVALIAQANSDGTYTPLVISEDSEVHTFDYEVRADANIVFSVATRHAHNAVCRVNMPDLFRRVTVLETGSAMNFMGMFHKIGVIGDSLSSGELALEGNVTDAYNFSWLSYLARRNNVDCAHYSAGGMSTRSWLNNTNGKLAAFNNDTPANAYFIALGSNDKNISEFPIGTIDDDENAQTFVGCYKKIISMSHAKNPNAPIFLVSLYTDNEASKPYTAMVQALAELYDYTFFVDYVNNSGGITVSTGGAYVYNSHFTTTGYLYVSQVIEKEVNRIVSENLDYFKWFGLYN